MSSIHVSIAAEKIIEVAGINITNSVLTTLLVSVALVTLALAVNLGLRFAPTRFQSFFEFVFETLSDIVKSVAPHNYKEFLPFILTFFLFILTSNWTGLLPVMGIGIQHKESLVPFIRPGTADLNTTLALALVSVLTTQYWGLKHLGISLHLKKYFNFSSPIDFFVGILEFIGEFVKILSFSFRLFGNIFAGETLLSVMLYLVPILIPLPFLGLEIFAGFIQAVVFSILTLVFFQMAVESHSH